MDELFGSPCSTDLFWAGRVIWGPLKKFWGIDREIYSLGLRAEGSSLKIQGLGA